MRQVIATLYSFVDKYLYWLHVPHVGVSDIVEILIIAVLLYYALLWFKNTRAWALFKGLLVLVIFLTIAALFQMNTILWLFGKLLNIAVIALIIIFQPELRRVLEQLGKNNFMTRVFNFDFARSGGPDFSEHICEEIIRASYAMGRARTGALIVIERGVSLEEYTRTGIMIDAEISMQLLLNIFEHNTPLHDGAVIVRGDRILAATCYLPLSDNMALSKDLGTRHRAGVGISEVSDSLTIIVSEETGAVSLADNGVLHHNVDQEFLREQLKRLSGRQDNEDQRFRLFRKGTENAEKGSKVDHE